MKPKSTRLNADNRNAFVQAVIEDVIPASKKPQLDNFKARWVDKIYDLTYGPYIKQMNALPKWFFARGTRLKVDMLERKNSYSDSVIFFE